MFGGHYIGMVMPASSVHAQVEKTTKTNEKDNNAMKKKMLNPRWSGLS